ncbi:MAG: hypothetical protein MJ236_05740, partial [Clostridia bacterium]|nr:hypothetical protein [Clostridia bacterium]
MTKDGVLNPNAMTKHGVLNPNAMTKDGLLKPNAKGKDAQINPVLTTSGLAQPFDKGLTSDIVIQKD